MSFFKGIGNVSLTQKICLAGLFAATATILQKVIAINYLAALPFFRISFGAPAIIVFSSIFLGPLWGALVGGLSDVIGYFAFDASSFPYMPQISLIYVVLGLLGFFIYKVVDKIGNEKRIFLIELGLLGLTLVGVSCYLIFFFDCSVFAKIFIPIGLLIFIVLLVVFQKIFISKESKIYAPMKISFTYFILDFLVLVIFGSLMKAWAFSSSYDNLISLFGTILITQSLVMIFNVVFNTLLLATFFRVTNKYVR